MVKLLALILECLLLPVYVVLLPLLVLLQCVHLHAQLFDLFLKPCIQLLRVEQLHLQLLELLRRDHVLHRLHPLIHKLRPLRAQT